MRPQADRSRARVQREGARPPGKLERVDLPRRAGRKRSGAASALCDPDAFRWPMPVYLERT